MYNVSVNKEKGLSTVGTRTVNLEKGSELGERRHRQQGKRSEAALLPAGAYQEVEVLKQGSLSGFGASSWGFGI